SCAASCGWKMADAVESIWVHQRARGADEFHGGECAGGEFRSDSISNWRFADHQSSRQRAMARGASAEFHCEPALLELVARICVSRVRGRVAKRGEAKWFLVSHRDGSATDDGGIGGRARH